MSATLELAPPSPQEVAAVRADESLLGIIGRAASDPAMDITKMERLVALHERMLARQAEIDFAAALAAAQKEMPPVVRMGRNEHTRSSYAKFEHVNEIAKPIYTKHGLSLVFSEGEVAGGKIRVLCEVRHAGGHATVKHLDLTPDDKGAGGNASKTKIHGEGSTFSYARRYLTVMIFNMSLVGEDDDGTHGQRPKPAGPSTLAADDGVKEQAKVLWTLLAPVRGTEKNWNQANQWLWREEILDGGADEAAPNLTAKRFQDVIRAVRERLQP